MNISLVEQLESLGLQPNESQMYLVLLELGKGTVSEISKAARLNRTTGYDILERICLYGLANRSTLGKKKHVYVAESPSRLKFFLENKKRSAERRLEEVAGIIPDLQSLYKKESKPVIKFFEGRDGIKNIYLHTLEAKSTIYAVLDFKDYLPEFDEFGKWYARERLHLGIKLNGLVVKNEAGKRFYETTYAGKKRFDKNTEYRWLEPESKLFPAAEVNVYDDKVMGVLIKPGENMAFEIQNKSFADSLKMIFEVAWVQGKVLKKK